MTILAYALDGCFRIRQVSETRAVIEIRSHLYPGDWIWCVEQHGWEINRAWEIFEVQSYFHCDPNIYFKPVVQPGV